MVYVTQEANGKNILSAQKYGKLMVLPGSPIEVTNFVVSPHSMRGPLQNFCDDDYLLLIGDPVRIAMAFAVAAFNNKGCVKVLKWDRQEKMYFPVQIYI